MVRHVCLNNRGFTLIEFLVSIVILSVGLLGLLQVVNVAYTHNLTSLLRNEAVMVADEELVRATTSMPFDNITATRASFNIRRELRSSSAFKNYSVTKRVRTLQDTTTSDGQQLTSKEVVITVNWKHKSSRYGHDISSIVSR